MGGKWKPDPETQRLVFKDVPSNILHIFKYMAKTHIDFAKGHGTYKTMPKQEQEQALTDYFSKIVCEHAEQRMGKGGFTAKMVNYQLDQKYLQEKIDEKQSLQPPK
jgi:hypothetical protein